ncbi:DUF2786 domain-containing protein [Actinoplanes sp. NPDC051851]|uniref:DUF2786 domain-containing protein n=1 Tax=Actinoplanes sp. NPDC051851 TaxID=3154753 RepID=UPI003446DEFB
MTTPQPDDKHLSRLRALLALATDKRTPFHERETAAAKAAEFMARHGIDEAKARAARGDAPEGLKVSPFGVANSDGHGQARSLMVTAVAAAMGCECLIMQAPPPRAYTVSIAGITSDVDAARLLLPLIIAQAHYAAASSASDTQRRDRAYLPSFLLSYGRTVADRIAARRKPLTDATANPGTALILADRAERLAALVAERFGTEFTSVSMHATGSGAQAGHRAGQTADIGDARLNNASRRAIDR